MSKIRLWIIYKEKIGFSRIIADSLQDLLDEYVNVSVGNVNKIDPAFLIEEKLAFLIFGDVIESEKVPSPELKNWFEKFLDLSEKNQLLIKSVSSYYVSSTDTDLSPIWVRFFQDYNSSLVIFPPVLQIKLKKGGAAFEKNILNKVKDYSKEFIDFFIDNKNGGI